MGSQRSGRRRTETSGTVEDAPRIDIREWVRWGVICDGERISADRRWGEAANVRDHGSFVVTADLTDPQDRHVLLSGSTSIGRFEQRIELVARPMRFGGLRFFFLCPVSGACCEVLTHGTNGFASAKANGLAYSSQREDQARRWIRASDKLEKRLWPNGDGRLHVRGRNKDRLLERYSEIEDHLDDIMETILRPS